MPKVIVERGRIQVLEPVSPYDGLVREFLATLEDVEAVLISGYPAIMLGRSRETEDIDLFLGDMGRDRFDAWWGRLSAAGFWCINAGPDGAWDLLQERMAPRFAKEGTIEPNFEVKFARERLSAQQLREAWDLDLLGVHAHIGDLSDQVAYKVFMGTQHDPGGAHLPVNKDMEDAEHIARVAGHAIDWARADRMISILGVPKSVWRKFRDIVS